LTEFKELLVEPSNFEFFQLKTGLPSYQLSNICSKLEQDISEAKQAQKS